MNSDSTSCQTCNKYKDAIEIIRAETDNMRSFYVNQILNMKDEISKKAKIGEEVTPEQLSSMRGSNDD